MKKKGIEISINFVIMLILAIAGLMLGISFVTKMFIKTDTIKVQLDKQAEDQLRAMQSSGKQVNIFPTRFDLQNGKTRTVGIGVFNRLPIDKETIQTTNRFFVILYFFKAVDNDGATQCSQEKNYPWGPFGNCYSEINRAIVSDKPFASYGYAYTFFDIPKNEQHDFAFIIQAPKGSLPGTYSYSVKVQYIQDKDSIRDVPSTADKDYINGVERITALVK